MNDAVKKTGVNILSKFGIKEKIIDPPGISTNEPIVFYAFLEKIEVVNVKNNEGGKMIPDELIIDKGEYTFHGKNYDLNREGIYRFVYPGIENKQRIVFEKNVDALLSSIAWIYSHGNKDDGKNYDSILNKAKNTKIFATCGSVSAWAVEFLKNQGLKSRIVATLTLDKWNSYDNGHILIEVFREELKKWVLYDIDNDVYFTRDNNALSLIEFSNCVRDDNYEINFIAKKNDVDTSHFIDKDSSYDFGFLIEARFLDQETRRKWYKRVFQVPMIVDGGSSYFFDNKNKDKILSYSSFYQYLEKHAFMEKFYSFDNS